MASWSIAQAISAVAAEVVENPETISALDDEAALRQVRFALFVCSLTLIVSRVPAPN